MALFAEEFYSETAEMNRLVFAESASSFSTNVHSSVHQVASHRTGK